MEKIQTIDIHDKSYSNLLKKIKDPPRVLYFRGEIKNKVRNLGGNTYAISHS